MAQIEKGRQAVQSLRARAKADYVDRGNRIEIDIALLAQRPARLRLAGENALTGPLLTVATDGEQFHLLDVRENRFMRGTVSPCNMSRILGVNFHPSQLIEVVMGGTPLLPDGSAAEVGWDPREGGRDVLTLRDARGVSEAIYLQALPVAAGTGAVAGAVAPSAWDVRAAEGRSADGTVVWRLRHEDYAVQPLGDSPAAPTLRLPGVTYLEDPPHKSDVRLRWREREFNPTLEAGLLQLPAPARVPVAPDTRAAPSARDGAPGVGQAP